MPLREFIDQTVKILGTDAEEILVERAKPMRNNVGPNEGAFVTQFKRFHPATVGGGFMPTGRTN